MELFEYLAGKGGIMILGLVAIVALVYRKCKEKRYFKHIDKRIQEKKENTI